MSPLVFFMLGLPFGLLHASTAPVLGFSHLRQHRVGKVLIEDELKII